MWPRGMQRSGVVSGVVGHSAVPSSRSDGFDAAPSTCKYTTALMMDTLTVDVVAVSTDESSGYFAGGLGAARSTRRIPCTRALHLSKKKLAIAHANTSARISR
ncbi:hypothetical protein PHYSODRAFT_294259 [Phytophthora sojae]|uniref:Uncharacterized protein n=1 Tax=Phytophthora sojae (strain P6497) TaxID=1094619 RepID=G4YKJ6_PHYSP|nr:hypothetical protein PHYSODRAFT_294259 [Phytophthora sojae]EGZ28828.1 hypothetical protein PHYSODRAFT_294259 [Phytophthora sojae]|eukprot:XP_009516103.1 hypothetical protein PHYSODRAFT_294259 [Phytophthora sojae]